MDQVLAETNLGYINSGVALRVQRFCLELATINDTQLSLSFLNKFQAMKVGPVLTSASKSCIRIASEGS